MKNYKHSVKSNNAMKLAAVASAAIMMAPVALNTVSTFAATGAQIAADKASYSKTDLETAYNAFMKKFNSLNAADQKALVDTETGKSGIATVGLDIYKAQTILGITPTVTVDDPYSNGYAAFYASASAEQKTNEIKGLYAKFFASDGADATVANKLVAAETADKTAASSLSDGATTAFKEYASTIAKAPSLASSTAATNLTKAVADAQQAAKTGTSDQVKAAASALAEAKAAFEKAYADFSQSAAEQTAKDNAAPASATNTAALAKAIEQAQALYGSTVKTTAPAAAAGFAAQIKGAQSIQSNIVSKKLTNKDVTAATADLNKAAATYAMAVATEGSQNDVQGYKDAEAASLAEKTTAKAALAKAIDNAKTSEAALASYKGTNAASVAAFNAFDGVIKAAQAVYENADATPAALNAAAANVAKAAATLGDTLAKNGNDFNNFKAAQNAILALQNLKQKIASTQTGVAHINYAKGYGIQIWTKDHKLVMTDVMSLIIWSGAT